MADLGLYCTFIDLILLQECCYHRLFLHQLSASPADRNIAVRSTSKVFIRVFTCSIRIRCCHLVIY
ncbi:hypothetical protein ACQKWADRAFT_297189, partial [Trichoderma austrokoningii]